MSIATVVTMGFGSFGSVNLLPTIGYDIGESEELSAVGLEITVPNYRMEVTVPDYRLEVTVPEL